MWLISIIVRRSIEPFSICAAETDKFAHFDKGINLKSPYIYTKLTAVYLKFNFRILRNLHSAVFLGSALFLQLCKCLSALGAF